MRDDVIVHPMSPGEHMGHAGILLLENRACLLGKERILVAEKTMAQGAVLVSTLKNSGSGSDPRACAGHRARP